jgi:hypothetical protein
MRGAFPFPAVLLSFLFCGPGIRAEGRSFDEVFAVVKDIPISSSGDKFRISLDDGGLWMLDAWASALHRYDSKGRLLRSFVLPPVDSWFDVCSCGDKIVLSYLLTTNPGVAVFSEAGERQSDLDFPHLAQRIDCKGNTLFLATNTAPDIPWVHVLNLKTGKILRTFGKESEHNEFPRFGLIAMDIHDRHVYVLDPMHYRIHKYSQQGTLRWKKDLSRFFLIPPNFSIPAPREFSASDDWFKNFTPATGIFCRQNFIVIRQTVRSSSMEAALDLLGPDGTPWLWNVACPWWLAGVDNDDFFYFAETNAKGNLKALHKAKLNIPLPK